MATQKVSVILDAENKTKAALDEAATGLGKFQKGVNSMQPAFKAMAVAGTAAFGGIAYAMKGAIDAANEADRIQAQLAAAIKSTGGAAGLFIEDLNDQAAALQRVTRYGDEAINSSQALLLTFTNVKGGVFQQATQAIVDMSAAMGTDLQGATLQVGKALNDPIQGISALQRVGVSFSDAQKEVIKKLVETGKTAEAQKLILAELSKEFGGSATAQAKTFGGQVEILKNRLGEIQEAVGHALIPEIEKLVAKIAPVVEKIVEWAEANPELIAKILEIGAGVAALVAVLGTIGVVMPAVITGFTLLTGTVGLVILAIGALVAAGIYLYRNWDEISAAASDVWNAIGAIITGAMESVMNYISEVMSAIANIFTTTWNGIQSAFWTYVDFVIGLWAMLLDALFPGWEGALTSIWNKTIEVFDFIKGYLSEVFGAIGAVFNVALPVISAYWSKIWTAIKDVFQSIWDIIKGIVSGAIDSIMSNVDRVIGPLQKVIDLAQRAYDASKNFIGAAGDKIGGAIQSVINRGSSITGRALGGPVSANTPYLVGENGPELFQPSTAGRIRPGGVGGVTYNIILNNNTFLGKEDVARQIGNEILNQVLLSRRLG